MLPVFDVYILPLSSPSEEDRIGRADFLATQTAKTVARQRQKSVLLLHLSLQGNRTLPPDKRTLLLQRLSEVFYKTPGTTTGALRTVAESLNQFLLDRNTRVGRSENQTVGILTQIVLQTGRLTIAQSGYSQIYWISSLGVNHLYDPDLAGQGLGISKVAKVRFVQGEIASGDSLLVCVQPPPTWTPSLLNSLSGQAIESIARKLADKTEIEGWVVQFKQGTGKIFQLPAISSPAVSESKSPSLVEAQQTSPPSPVDLGEQIPAVAAPVPLLPREESSLTAIAEPSFSEQKLHHKNPNLPSETPVAVQPPSLDVESLPKDSLLIGLSKGLQGVRHRLFQVLGRWLPDSSVFQIPTPIMALIAILTPLVVVTLASAVYFQQGQVGEFERYLQLAQQAAQQAQTLPDPLAQRSAWQATLGYLDQATRYATSSEAQALRAQAYAAIDQIDSIKRLDFAVAVDDLPKEAQITKIAVTENELFLLDANAGVVWRASAAARGYVLNTNASCGAGIQGAAVGKLVGFGLIREATQLQAVIVGMDAMGKVVTCDYNVPPVVDSVTPDERGMGTVSGFLIERGNGYVLDPQKNAVWIYWKNKFGDKPELFFSQDVPPMQNVIDFAVYGEDLYLLYADGHLAQCTYSATSPTRCVDPQPYKDTRPGRENQPLQSETPFTRLYVSQPPDPALYLLEPSVPAVYQFSLRLLAFHSQLRSIPTPSFSPLPQGVPATALAVSSEQRLVFLAFGNRIYYANLP